MTSGFRLSLAMTSWKYSRGSAQSHCVMTTLRSASLRPRRRLLAGYSPAAIRSVQSANIFSARWRPSDVSCCPCCDAVVPGRHARAHAVNRRFELAELGGNLARRLVAELMARHAAVGLQLLQELALAAAVRGTLLLERELALLGQLEQRQPVVRRVVLAPPRADSAR